MGKQVLLHLVFAVKFPYIDLKSLKLSEALLQVKSLYKSGFKPYDIRGDFILQAIIILQINNKFY